MLQEEAHNLFTSMFSVYVQLSRHYIMENKTPSIPHVEKEKFICPVYIEEVRRAIITIRPFKALRHDGIQNYFYK